MTVPQLATLFGDGFLYEDKITFSCADDEVIIKKIEDTGKKNILIFGIEAHICVLQTAIDLLEKGYNVILVENCISSRKEKDRIIGIQRAVAEGAILTTYEAILFELTRSAKHNSFKEISSLIK
jgi:nicotinamidase-related amidase